ncbi:cytidine deaminase-like protein [Endogone sp. FLAS-F59071]|nr:cytidine deaminase-like protein [Endogone sp. FLAS-F59071]|eukprot:RUS17761.1 cytidine deaminase-like protein [Endogone sp. FLAS-F59071]
MTSQQARTPLEPVPPDEETRGLETIDVYVSDLDPKETGRVLKFIQKNCPQLENCEHLKRIKKTFHDDQSAYLVNISPHNSKNAFTLTLLICSATAISRAALLALIDEHQLNDVIEPRINPVPRYAPCTRAQFEQWKMVWPLSFREDPRREIKFIEKEIAVIKSHIHTVFQLSETAKSNGEYSIAALIVDPATSTVLATSTDTRRSTCHPLRHAVMNCIDRVAVREKATKTLVASIPPEPVDPADTRTVPQKRKVGEIDADIMAVDGDRSKRDSATILVPDATGKAAYLCTGYDLYVSHEPCVMCSMALVHSRIARVFYARPSPSSGGLGSVYKIHSYPSLNHHYKVFRWVGEGEVDAVGDIDV